MGVRDTAKSGRFEITLRSGLFIDLIPTRFSFVTQVPWFSGCFSVERLIRGTFLGNFCDRAGLMNLFGSFR